MSKAQCGLAVLVGMGLVGGGCATRDVRAEFGRSDKALAAYVESKTPPPADFPSVGWTLGSSAVESE